MIKEIQQWYSRLEPRGKVILALALIGWFWLITQLILAIAGVSLALGWFGFILNLLAMLLITLVVVQFVVTRNMQKEYEANLKEIMVKGRRGGNPGAQVSGHRNRGSMRKGSSNNAANSMLQVTTGLSVENLDKHYRAKMVGKPTIVSDWKEITSAGFYALDSDEEQKVEVIDASDIGGGFFVGKYSGKYVRERVIMTNQAGDPLRFATLRNAKQALSGKNPNAKRQHKKKKKRKK